MSFINYQAREINAKIVYFGSPNGGKSTNLNSIYSRISPDSKGKLLAVASTDMDQTIFFDFLPADLPDVRGFKVRIHVYTVKSERVYTQSLLKNLKGADGVVLVVDSDPASQEANQQARADLESMLKESGSDIATMPYVIQYNKRDLPGVPTVAELRAQLNTAGVADFEAVATTGTGVWETLKSITKPVHAKLKR